MTKQYIHYGSNEFDKRLFRQPLNYPYFNKPIGGLWASPTEPDYYGWKEWCLDNHFNIDRLNKSFIFTLKDDAKILSIRNRREVYDLPSKFLIEYPYSNMSYIGQCQSFTEFLNKCKRYSISVFLDFERIIKEGYDAIEYSVYELYMELYGWDVDSLLVLNPNVVIQV